MQKSSELGYLRRCNSVISPLSQKAMETRNFRNFTRNFTGNFGLESPDRRAALAFAAPPRYLTA
ncbi:MULTISPECIES: hypothetical protein [unclassified Sphingomonas]|uniref:hypothetical protein n=1 Tax=unclassified Sphingomonas TaxID=196159 RepID=UPI0035A9091F